MRSFRVSRIDFAMIYSFLEGNTILGFYLAVSLDYFC